MNQVYLQLGSNLGNRENFLQSARDFISKELGLIENVLKSTRVLHGG
jgi:7,8-dihydro-6-hydroxymethylpterin-pyrophosphokinase